MLDASLPNAQTRVQARIMPSELRPPKENLHVRIQNIPIIEGEYLLKRIPSADHLHRLLAVTGTVTRTNQARLIERRRLFRCQKCFKTVTAFPDDRQFGSISKPLYCPHLVDDIPCPSNRFEAVMDEANNCQDDYQEIRLQEDTSQLDIGAVPRSIAVILKHDLVDKCQPGDSVMVIGYLIHRWKPFRVASQLDGEYAFVANNLLCSARSLDQLQGESRAHVNRRAEVYWQGHQTSPMMGRHLLVDSFCPQVHGLCTVKLAVLLTVIGGGGGGGGADASAETMAGTEQRREGHLLMVGDPGTAKSQLLLGASRIARRAVVTTGAGTTNAGLTAAAVRDGAGKGGGTGEWTLEAGAMVLADGGLCCIDEFNALSERDRTALHEAMEQQTLSVAKAGLVCRLSTKCSVVAACNSRGKWEAGTSITANIALASPLLSRFDLILLLLDQTDEQWDQALSAAVLKKACQRTRKKQDAALFDEEALKTYVAYVQTRPLSGLSPEARLVLGRYYQSQRDSKDRDVARTTVRLLESLTRLAQAHARLMCHRRVELADAVSAIMLMESSLLRSPDGTSMRGTPDCHRAQEAYEAYEAALLQRLTINKSIVLNL